MRHSLVLAACLLALSGRVGAVAPVRVAVLPMAVHSLEESEYLREGLASMILARLGRSPSVTVVPLLDAGPVRSAAEARKALGSTQADYVVFGALTHFGQAASLDLHCLPLGDSDTAESRTIFIQAGSLDEVIPQLDTVVRKLLHYLRFREANRP